MKKYILNEVSWLCEATETNPQKELSEMTIEELVSMRDALRIVLKTERDIKQKNSSCAESEILQNQREINDLLDFLPADKIIFHMQEMFAVFLKSEEAKMYDRGDLSNFYFEQTMVERMLLKLKQVKVLQ